MYIEIIKIVMPAILGGGLWHIITLRRRLKQDNNAVAKEEFQTVLEIVEQSTQKLATMADQISQVQQQKIELETKLAQCNAAARAHQAEAERWKQLAQTINKNE